VAARGGAFLSALLITIALFFSIVKADTTTPEFVSLKSSMINMRVGPGKEFPVSWTFIKVDLPMMLIAEFNEWKKVRFIDQTEGWIHKSMVTNRNTALVAVDYTILYRQDSTSHPIAKIEKNVIVKVIKTHQNWVKVAVGKIKGWVKKHDLWGVNIEQE
jgi:SH3-like domain-containing protein